MENTMISIGKYITANHAAFGLASAADYKPQDDTGETIPNGAKWLIADVLSDGPDASTDVPFNNLLTAEISGEQMMALIDLIILTRSPDPSKTFYWNTARKMRQKIYSALAGSNGGGLVIPRYDWTDPANPVQDGEIWFEVDSRNNSPIIKEITDSKDKANKYIYMTYRVHYWKSQLETAPTDTWLEALSAWTEGVMGAGWTVYRGAWPLGYVRPAVMWRITGAEVTEKGLAMYEVRKRFSGHVLGRTRNEQVAGAVALTQELGKAVKLPIDPVDRRYMTVKTPALNLQADALSAGQLSLVLSRNTNRPTEDVPYIMQVQGSGSLS